MEKFEFVPVKEETLSDEEACEAEERMARRALLGAASGYNSEYQIATEVMLKDEEEERTFALQPETLLCTQDGNTQESVELSPKDPLAVGEATEEDDAHFPAGAAASGALPKEVVRSKLEDGSFKLLTKAVNDKTSLCWANFQIVVDSATDQPVGFVQCMNKSCKAILVYKGSTTGMNRHKCCVNSNAHKPTTLFREEQINLIEKWTVMCTNDFPPFNVVGEGFINVAQELINLGAKYGQLEAAEVLPHPRTISRHVADMAGKIKQELLPKIKEAIKNKQCAMSFDLWCDNYRRIHYVTVTASHIEETDSWDLRRSTILTTEFPDVPETGEGILSEIEEHMSEINISADDLKKVTFVAEQGSNIQKALENHGCLPCLIHCIGTSLCHILDDQFLCDNMPGVLNSIQSARKIVGFMKRSGLAAKLPSPLYTDLDTRWNGVFTLLNSFDSQYQEICDLLHEEGKRNAISGYNRSLMKELVEFLKQFKEATDDLGGEKGPTLPFAVPWTFTLLAKCEVGKADSESMQKIKKRAKHILTEELFDKLGDIHYVATFLHPSFKELLPLDPVKRTEVHQFVQRVCKTINAPNRCETTNCPAKKFREWRSSSMTREDVDKYVAMEVPADCENLLFWWKAHSLSLPKLSIIAKQVLCVPAASVATARSTSQSGLIVTDRRSSMDPNHVNDLLIIYNNQLHV